MATDLSRTRYPVRLLPRRLGHGPEDRLSLRGAAPRAAGLCHRRRLDLAGGEPRYGGFSRRGLPRIRGGWLAERAPDSGRSRSPGDLLQKIGDFSASGLDTAAIEAAGTSPIEPEIARIQGLTDLESLQTEIAELHAIGVDVAFDFGPMPDPLESTRNIGVIDEGGLGLPDRTYYFSRVSRTSGRPASAPRPSRSGP